MSAYQVFSKPSQWVQINPINYDIFGPDTSLSAFLSSTFMKVDGGVDNIESGLWNIGCLNNTHFEYLNVVKNKEMMI